MDYWNVAAWIGKVMFVAFFAVSGIGHFTQLQAMTAYTRSKNVPLPGVAVVVTGAMLIAGSAMILFHWHMIWGSGLLFLFLVPTAFLMHNFWTQADPNVRMTEMAHFWKNLTLAGATLLLAVAVHRGAFSA